MDAIEHRKEIGAGWLDTVVHRAFTLTLSSLGGGAPIGPLTSRFGRWHAPA
jgi:hypothetical protein